MNLRRLATGIELAVLAAVTVTVVLLFTNDPTPPPPAAAGPADDAPQETTAEKESVAPAGIDPAAVYGDGCAGCHGGDGSGGIGPGLSGGRVVASFPDAADQVAVVTDGRGGMPGFGDRLSAEAISAVVDYTRTVLAGG